MEKGGTKIDTSNCSPQRYTYKTHLMNTNNINCEEFIAPQIVTEEQQNLVVC